jgi:hypothetical protein
MVSSIVKTIDLAEIVSADDPTIDQVELLRWGYIESALVIITSSIPCLRSLVVSMKNNYSSRETAHNYELRTPYHAGNATATVNSRRIHKTKPTNMHPHFGSEEHILEIDQVDKPITDNGSSKSVTAGITRQFDISVVSKGHDMDFDQNSLSQHSGGDKRTRSP